MSDSDLKSEVNLAPELLNFLYSFFFNIFSKITDTALDLMELGFELKRQSLKREMIDQSDQFINAELQEWIEAR